MRHFDEPRTDKVGTITIPCPANIHYGCISASGKSFTFRTREKAEGPVSEYRNIRLPFKIQDFKKGFYHKSDLFRYDFGQGEEPAVIIKYHKI